MITFSWILLILGLIVGPTISTTVGNYIIAIAFVLLASSYFSKFRTWLFTWILGNNTCPSYPVFTKVEIVNEQVALYNTSRYWNKIFDKMSKKMDKEKASSLKDFSPEAKELRKKSDILSAALDLHQNRLNAMIEANIAVLNGKTIDVARKDFDKKFRYTSVWWGLTKILEKQTLEGVYTITHNDIDNTYWASQGKSPPYAI